MMRKIPFLFILPSFGEQKEAGVQFENKQISTFMKNVIFYSFLWGLVAFCLPQVSAQSLALNLSVNTTAASCGADGTLQAVATGGQTPYLYEIIAGPITTSFPQLSGSFSPMPAGTYTLRVTDANAAIALSTATVVNTYVPMNATYTSNPVTACNPSSGSIQVNVTGGLAPLSYAFAPQGSVNYGTNQVSNNYTGLAVDNYKVRISDACSNTSTLQNMSVVGYKIPTLFYTPTHPTNCTSWNGQIAGTVIGGQAPYTYTLLPNNISIPATSATTYNFSNLAAGAYTVKVIDNCGKVGTIAVTLNAPAAPNMSVAVTTTTNANCTGNITATASGGFAAYTYQLDNGTGQASGSFLNVSAGLHTIKATDACGNIRTTTVSVASTSISVNVTMSSPTSANVTATGGSAPYTYVCTSCNPSVSNTTGSFTNLPPSTNTNGTYTFSVNGACGSNGTASNGLLCPGIAYVFGSCGNIDKVVLDNTYANAAVWEFVPGLPYNGGYQMGTTDANGDATIFISGYTWMDSIYVIDPISGGVCRLLVSGSWTLWNQNCILIQTAPGSSSFGTTSSVDIGVSLDCINGMGWHHYSPSIFNGMLNMCTLGGINYGSFVPMNYTEQIQLDCGIMADVYYPSYGLEIDPNSNKCAGGSDIHVYLTSNYPINFYDPNQAVSYYFRLKDATGTVVQTLDDPYADVTFHNLMPGTYTVVLMDFTNTCELDSITYTIGYYTAPIADASVGIVCPTSSTTTIQVSVTHGQAPYVFERLHPVSNAVLSSSGSTMSATYNFTGLPLGSYKFRVRDTCGVSSIDYSLVMPIDSLPITYDLLCNNQLVLKAPFVYNATYLWKKGTTTLGTTRNVSIAAQTSAQTYTVTITLGSCSKTYSLNTPAFTPSTLSANAGVDATFYVANPSLNALTPPNGATGTWSFVMGTGTASIVAANSPSSMVNVGTVPGQYKLLWTVTDGTCIIADTVMLTILPTTSNLCANDTTPPTITFCPANMTVNNDTGLCGAAVFYNVAAIDSCSAVTVVMNPPSGNFFPVGTHPVNVTATDASGNVATCSFTVTVNDVEPPVVSVQDITAYADSVSCGTTVNFTIPTTDNCGIASIVTSKQSGDYFSVGTSNVSVQVTDIHGNISNASFNVTVIDTIKPLIIGCQDIVAYVAAGQCDALVDYDITFEDNCKVDNPGYSIVSGSVFPIGTTTVLVWIKDIYGNKSECEFTVTVLDTIAPVISGCQDIIAYVPSGQCNAQVNYNITFSDNCTLDSSYYSIVSGSIFPIGATNVFVSIEDIYGNESTCQFTVTVLDTIAPIISCPANITVVGTNLNGNCSGLVTFSVAATDNCATTVTTVPASGSIFPSGITTVVATAIDPSGNSSTCSFQVEVLCNSVPIYEVQNDTITCEEACTCCGNKPKVCIPLVATSAVPNGIIGMDFCMSYDQNLVHPTGNATLGQVVLTSTNNPATDADFSINTQFTNPGELHVSIYYTGGIYNFTGAGDIICVEFELLPTFTAGQTTCFGICELIESYQSNILFSSATTGCLTFENDSVMEGRVIFWDKQNKPLDDSPTADVNGTDANCNAPSPIVAQTDALGYFNYNIANGVDIQINREIGATNVMSIVNGYDCNLTSLVTTVNNIYFPNPYQMIAMDVNLDGNVSAGDITLIQQRIVLNTTDYNVQGKDWQFTDVPTVNNDASYQISTNFPSPDAAGGYYRFNVPTIPNCMPVQVTQNGLICTKIDSQEFRGILLGDVNGNWTNASLLKTSATDDIVFDLTQATKDKNTCAVRIPVYYQSTNNLLSLDFDMDYDQTAMQIVSVSQDANAPTNLMMMSNNYQSDRLMLTSYLNGSMNGVNYNANPIFWIEVQTPGASQTVVTDAMLGNILAYFNGNLANATIKGSIADCKSLNTTGIEEQILMDVNVYPQPVNDILTITYPAGVAQLALFDAQGKFIQNIEINADGKSNMDMSALANGIYFLQINQQYSKKVIK